jgi:hypothetical protein
VTNWVTDIGLIVAMALVMRLLMMDKLPSRRGEKIFALVVSAAYFACLGLLVHQIYEHMTAALIAGWVFIGLIALTFVAYAFRDFVVKRMAESFELGMKLGVLRGQIAGEQMDGILRDAGLDPTQLPDRNTP